MPASQPLSRHTPGTAQKAGPTPQSKADALYDCVKGDILSLAMMPGEALRLPALSERYGIGLTPLRDCLTRLGAEHLVVTEHNKGFRVAPLSLDDLLDLEATRSVIEGSLFAKAVAEGGEAWEAAVVGTFHQLAKTPFPSVLREDGELEVWTRRHGAFHSALVSGAQSVWRHRFCEALGQKLSRYHRFIQVGLRNLWRSEPAMASEAAEVFSTAMELGPHRLLYDTALARDIDAAPVVFAQHANLSSTAFRTLVDLVHGTDGLGRVLIPTDAPTTEAAP
ncbi:MAG: GntR family transcriptional regulator [Pseudomonadota bacterium]